MPERSRRFWVPRMRPPDRRGVWYGIMVIRLFLPQARLEQWITEDKVDLLDDKLFVKAEGLHVPLQSAAHFQKLITGTDDAHLISKVKTDEQLRALKCE